MNTEKPGTEAVGISMIRETLEDLPVFDLPAPYTLRWYQPGDEENWVEIHKAADPAHPYSLEKFAREFEADRALLPLRQAYLCDGKGEAVGTTTAWFYEVEQKEFGLVHWVAIHPQHQGRGLANPLLSLICQRLRELGHTQAYLNTSTGRIPAIGLYLKFGFVPHIRGDDATALRAWSQVRQQLAHPAVDEFLNRISLMHPPGSTMQL